MSADMMPCGCLGHADHEELCRYPALEAERNNLRARAEQAEGQQRSDVAKMQAWRERAERAEADNAALLDALRDAITSLGWAGSHFQDGTEERLHWENDFDRARRNRDKPHPGAALLERVRALEAVRAAVEPTRRLTELFLASAHGHHVTETERALVDACALVDALKSQPARQYVDVEKVREVLTAARADRMSRPVIDAIAERLGVDLDTKGERTAGLDGTDTEP